jgi:hypothetical protein
MAEVAGCAAADDACGLAARRSSARLVSWRSFTEPTRTQPNIFCNTQKNLRYPFLFLNRFHASESYRARADRYRYFLFSQLN